MDFPIRLENLLEEHNLTQKQLAKELHIAPSTINGYLRRGQEPNFSTLIRLSEYFDVSIDYLLGITCIRRPMHSDKYHSSKEKDLLNTYRALDAKEQGYLIRQAHMYHYQNMSTSNPTNGDWSCQQAAWA